MSGPTWRYVSVTDPRNLLATRLKDVAASRARYGYRRLGDLLRREGWRINNKRISTTCDTSGHCLNPDSPAIAKSRS